MFCLLKVDSLDMIIKTSSEKWKTFVRCEVPKSKYDIIKGIKPRNFSLQNHLVIFMRLSALQMDVYAQFVAIWCTWNKYFCLIRGNIYSRIQFLGDSRKWVQSKSSQISWYLSQALWVWIFKPEVSEDGILR